MTVGDELHECEADSHGNPAGESSPGGLTRLTFTHDDDGRHATASTHGGTSDGCNVSKLPTSPTSKVRS